MPYGYNGRVLHVDLTRQTWWVEQPPELFYRTYLGGSGMGTCYLLKEMRPGVDALSPNNVLTLFTGPATGAAISGASRVCANARSPLTGAIGDSQAGGFWPAELKAAGFDGLVLKGRAPRPVYLWIHEGEVELRDASHLWGRVTGEVQQSIREELGDPRIEVLQIGPAGERLVRYAAIINMCSRANGRTGLGAVMGSKNLKAIAVRGKSRPQTKDTNALRELARWGAEAFPKSELAGLRDHGTGATVAPQQAVGGLPTRNWESGVFDGWEAIDGMTITGTVLKGRDTCFGCIVRCKRVVEIAEGPYPVDPLYGGPEYETLAALGSYCGVDDLAAICKANELCNKYGLDTITTGAVIAWAMDAYEHGMLTVADTDGLELCFGNASAMVEMTRRIAERRGLGDLLAEGSTAAARRIGRGSEALLATGKGQELPAHSQHVKRSLALIYAVNPYGADHQSHEHDPTYLPGPYEQYLAEIGLLEPIDDLLTLDRRKVRASLYTQWVYSLANSLALCQFVWGPAWQLYHASQIATLVQAVTGWNITLWELIKAGERTLNLQRAFNAREGFTSREDVLSPKALRALRGGPSDGLAVDEAELARAREVYYAMCGWDAEGRPTRGKLEELDLGWVADMLYGTQVDNTGA
jgi:aldehyde:ferredoxin oxidoreductase